MSFNDGRFDGGFRRSAEPSPSTGVLLIFFSTDLERDLDRVQELGATISEAIFPFPGGRRFHFVDPTGTEYAIWSEVPLPANGE
jgi:predicted enzyme related to lactoylglutathione lyase